MSEANFSTTNTHPRQQIQRLWQRKQRRLNPAPQPQKRHAVHQVMRTHIHSIIAIFYPFWRGYGVELLRQ